MAVASDQPAGSATRDLVTEGRTPLRGESLPRRGARGRRSTGGERVSPRRGWLIVRWGRMEASTVGWTLWTGSALLPEPLGVSVRVSPCPAPEAGVRRSLGTQQLDW